MTLAPSVSIVTPTHNHERYIAACIESVLAQTLPDWEMVIVDDGSRDRTLEIARSYTDARIRVLAEEHTRGLPRLVEAYRDALDASTAPLIAILEGDDTWPPEKLATQVPSFEQADVVLAYGAAGQIDSEGCLYGTYRRRPPGSAAHNRPVGSIVPHLLNQNFIVAATVVVRRTTLEDVGGFWQPEGIPYVDHPTWLKLALHGAFAWHDTIVGNWRRHPAQFTTTQATGPQPDTLPFLREMLERSVAAGVINDADAEAARLASSPGRRSGWTDVAELRLALLNGSVSEAAAAARPLFRPRAGWPKWAALGVVGLGCRIFGSDLEWVFRATNRFSWPPRRHRHGGSRSG